MSILAIAFAAGCAAAPDPSPSPSGSAPRAEDLRPWLENAIVCHRFTTEETARALGLTVAEVESRIAALDIDPARRPRRGSDDPVLVLPYPGGRHPRIGFLDGAIDPRRGTKASVFLPWEGSGYVVVDLPEAIWVPPELIFLAHTHIPTLWEKRKIDLPEIEWSKDPGGALAHEMDLPDGTAFGARIRGAKDGAVMDLWIRNGTKEILKGVRVQICVLLKGAPAFAQLAGENKVRGDDWIAVRSEDGKRWIATAWEPGRPWDNPEVPCMHSDPYFPDIPPGKTVRARGRIFFFEGEKIEVEIARRREAGTLFAPGTVSARP
ncbi:MAG: hypothetical protein JXP34_01570 [Planctomycetes bacterium]|nr:hypothetical protein [Planctomycetota bacterium]